MEAIFKNKLLLSATLILILAMFGYRFFSSDSLESHSAESATVAGQDLLRISDELARAQLSQDLFTLPGYRYLTDFTAPIPQQSIGRTNPFGIIGQ
jgi:hypothetical protein